MTGSPGSGKTLLASVMPGILPEMSIEESLDVTRIYSVADQLPPDTLLLKHRPFRVPHHAISHVGLVGGGNIPHPGEISLAHRGVLFLDEFPEFGNRVLEVMRQPVEDKVVTNHAIVTKYQKRISGPMLDRKAPRVRGGKAPRVDYEKLSSDRKQVQAARERQRARSEVDAQHNVMG